ncbi:MAG: class I SAM-dependent methyltransferase [Ilumatobacteraceae bacterium]
MHDDQHDDLRAASRTVNHANWESRVAVHASSDEYDLDAYRRDPTRLSDVVSFDLPRLGAIDGLDVVHLQCHIGTDTLSLARLGARVTGLDFSRSAIDVARDLASTAGPPVEFVVADVDDAVDALGAGSFDLVYTGIGALCWLPDIRSWAATVAALLRPGGHLFIREGHPVLWAMDDPRPDGLLVMAHPYFETGGVAFSESQTYAGDGTPIGAPDIVHFNHGLSEIFNAVWDAGLEITMFQEHHTVPWNPVGEAMHPVGGGEYELIEGTDRLPATYTLRAAKR